MRIIQCESKAEAIETVALILSEKMSSHPNAVIGLATGQTMIPVYESLVDKIKNSEISIQEVFFFMLDEYLGLPENHPSSFKSYIKKHLLNPLSLQESQFSFPPTHAEDGASHYEQSIKESGGVDLQLLGIGQNGHIGFNEPGSDLSSRTRIVELTANTLKANQGQFADIIPSHALSMGIATILEAKSLLLLATGSSKADTIKYLLNNHDDPSCPATYLKRHAHLTIVLDPEAGSKINLKI